jgi:hypothetical protein
MKANTPEQYNRLFAGIDDYDKIFEDNRYHLPEPNLADDWRSPKVSVNFKLVKN